MNTKILKASINFLENFEKKPVICYDIATNEEIHREESICKMAAKHGISTVSICQSCSIVKPKRKRKGNMSRKLNKRVYFKYLENK